MNYQRHLLLTLLLVHLICLFSCYPDNIKVEQIPLKRNDTVQAFNILLDSIFNKKLIEEPEKFNRFFQNNPYKDKVIFLKDSVFTRYLDTVNFNIKILSESQICSHILNKQRVSKETFDFPLVLNTWYGKTFTDSTFGAVFNIVFPSSNINQKGEFQEKPGGVFFESPDSCGFWVNDFGSFYEMEFIKRRDTLIILQKKNCS